MAYKEPKFSPTGVNQIFGGWNDGFGSKKKPSVPKKTNKPSSKSSKPKK